MRRGTSGDPSKTHREPQVDTSGGSTPANLNGKISEREGSKCTFGLLKHHPNESASIITIIYFM